MTNELEINLLKKINRTKPTVNAARAIYMEEELKLLKSLISEGKVIMYADELTESMEKAITETNRRRKIQSEYNKKHNITPKTINKAIRDTIKATMIEDIQEEYHIEKEESIEEVIAKLTEEMLKYAANMEFEKAAELRDKIKELEGL